MNYYFVGIGGIGMSAIARFFHQRGDKVCGYDRTPSPLTRELEQEGIPIHYVDDPSLIPADTQLAVYTPAVPEDTLIMQHLRQSSIPLTKRSQMLGHLTEGRKCVAVAGTHGKTTTSSMIAWILSQSHVGCSAFLGGIAKNFNNNMIVDNKSDFVVVEADEYDRSFLQLHPYYSVISATDPDHLDIYGTHEKMLEAFEQFANQTHPEGMVLLKEGIPTKPHQSLARRSYSSNSTQADFYCHNIRNHNGDLTFDIHTPSGELLDIQLTNSCLYNVENAVAAAAIALQCGVTEAELRHGLKTFAGIRRRFDYRVKNDRIIYIDDYAHHPAEIKATLDSVRFLFPGRKVMGIFQPHLYTRTRDFAAGFSEILSTLDEAILLDIYPARELPIPGITSDMLLRNITAPVSRLIQKDEVVPAILQSDCQIVLTIGAGDIDRLIPQIEQALES